MRSPAALAAVAASAAVLGAASSPVPASAADLSPSAVTKLESVIADSRRDDDRARDRFRHPAETLEFFEITPDMLVVEAMPGDGWYTRVLLPYLTPEGGYAAVNYSEGMAEQLANGHLNDTARAFTVSWPTRFLDEARADGPENAPIEAVFLYNSIPDSIRGQVDAVLYIRALHQLSRTGELQNALTDTYDMLKPGGVVGVVQHKAQSSTPPDYDTTGTLGYLREDEVIRAFESIGFVYEGHSTVNLNPLDHADHPGGSWSMPPTGHNPMTANLGESNRMTLRFRKPAE